MIVLGVLGILGIVVVIGLVAWYTCKFWCSAPYPKLGMAIGSTIGFLLTLGTGLVLVGGIWAIREICIWLVKWE